VYGVNIKHPIIIIIIIIIIPRDIVCLRNISINTLQKGDDDDDDDDNNTNNKYHLGTGIRIDLVNPLPVVRGEYLGRLS
jgi:hypothetical protein